MPSPSINKLPIVFAFIIIDLKVMIGGSSDHPLAIIVVMNGLNDIMMTVSEGARSVHAVRRGL